MVGLFIIWAILLIVYWLLYIMNFGFDSNTERPYYQKLMRTLVDETTKFHFINVIFILNYRVIALNVRDNNGVKGFDDLYNSFLSLDKKRWKLFALLFPISFRQYVIYGHTKNLPLEVLLNIFWTIINRPVILFHYIVVTLPFTVLSSKLSNSVKIPINNKTISINDLY